MICTSCFIFCGASRKAWGSERRDNDKIRFARIRGILLFGWCFLEMYTPNRRHLWNCCCSFNVFSLALLFTGLSKLTKAAFNKDMSDLNNFLLNLLHLQKRGGRAAKTYSTTSFGSHTSDASQKEYLSTKANMDILWEPKAALRIVPCFVWCKKKTHRKNDQPDCETATQQEHPKSCESLAV